MINHFNSKQMTLGFGSHGIFGMFFDTPEPIWRKYHAGGYIGWGIAFPYLGWGLNDRYHDGPENDDWIRGAGHSYTSARGGWGNSNEALRMYTLFLKCYDKFTKSHDHEVAMATCQHLRNGVPMFLQDMWEDLREEKKWAGARSSYVRVSDDDDDDDEDDE